VVENISKMFITGPNVIETVLGEKISQEDLGDVWAFVFLQVKEVLGTPLVTSVFHDERWDYVFTIRRQGVPPQSFSLSVWFKGDALDRVTGDELPSEVEFVTKLVVKKSGLKVPELEAKEEDLRKYPAPVRKSETAATPATPLPATYPPVEPNSR
jgi:outer membrane protein assembly factor BamE